MYSRKTPSAKELVENYLDKLLSALRDEESINSAVRARQTLIINPALSGANRASLSEIADQIDDLNANRKADATFAYHGGERAQEEIARYTHPDLSDWEKIALVSAYFQAGSDTQLELAFKISPTQMQEKEVQDELKLAGKILSEIQWQVANELRASIGFTAPKGYVVKEAALSAIRDLRQQPDALAEQVTKVASFKLKLEELRDKLIPQRKHLSDKIAKNTDSHLSTKHQLLDDALNAISRYDANRDLGSLASTIAELAKRDSGRVKVGWWKHPTSDLIQELNTLVGNENKDIKIKEEIKPTNS